MDLPIASPSFTGTALPIKRATEEMHGFSCQRVLLGKRLHQRAFAQGYGSVLYRMSEPPIAVAMELGGDGWAKPVLHAAIDAGIGLAGLLDVTISAEFLPPIAPIPPGLECMRAKFCADRALDLCNGSDGEACPASIGGMCWIEFLTVAKSLSVWVGGTIWIGPSLEASSTKRSSTVERLFGTANYRIIVEVASVAQSSLELIENGIFPQAWDILHGDDLRL